MWELQRVRQPRKGFYLVKETITSIALLKGKKLATAGNEEFTKNILTKMLGEGEKEIIDSLKILNVPKEIDALIAVGLEWQTLP